MSTIAAVAPGAATPTASAGAPAGVLTSTAKAPEKKARSTPSMLRLLLTLGVLAGLAFGAAGFQTGTSQARATADASAEATQLIGIQSVRNDLVRADAIAANAFLVGGLEPADQRADYDTAIADATKQLATLAADDAAGTTDFSQVDADIAVYTGLIEQARANNRQGFPVGAAYLSQASTLLNDSTLPQLQALVLASADRAAGSFTATTVSLVWLVIALVALVALVWVHLWITRRTHRYLNLPLLIAAAAMLVVGVIGVITFSNTASSAIDARQNSYAKTLAISQAYTSATEAKSLESFTLIKRGSGAALETEAQAAIADAQSRLDSSGKRYEIGADLRNELNSWVEKHKEIRDQDDAGNWDAAVQLAISPDAGKANAAFATFSDNAEQDVTAGAAATTNALDGGGALSQLLGWLFLVTGLAAAALAWRGVSLRLKEYR
ncbi:hypothetical protein [Agreia sp. COWG]|uniref:hypothetical protein n=1 Tax=Agreia sp. COWG TaxID=2773266 RepID=UPI0019263FB4|nr:hypothetical protein [Agreia sp. COWG]CAD5994268.1 conserved membrane protein of unknown function [Agreia sp. COWG]